MYKTTLSLIFIALLNSLVLAQPAVQLKAAERSGVVIDYPEALVKAGVRETRCIFKDSRNFMWIGTSNGLYRFDGTNVDLLEHEAGNLHTIPNNTIVSLAEDRDGHIWAGTMMGAARIDPQTLECTVFNQSAGGLPGDFDVKIYVDRQGKIWAGTAGGIFLFYPGEHRFRNVWQDRSGRNTGIGYVNCLTEWKNDTLIAGTFNGAILLNKKTFGYRWLNPLKKKLTVISLYADQRQCIWMGTWNDGLIKSDSSMHKFTSFKWEKPSKNNQANIITGILSTNYSSKHGLWVSTSAGMYEIKETEKDNGIRVTKIEGLDNGFIHQLMADDDGRIWEAGDQVSGFFAESSFFSVMTDTVENYVSDIQSLNFNGKPSVAVSCWYGGSGLTVFTKGGTILYKQPSPKKSAEADVSGIVQDKLGRFWMSTLDGIHVYDRKFDEIKPAAAGGNYRQLTSLRTNAVAICHDTVWVGCYRDGIRLFDLNFHLLKTYRPGDGSGLGDNLLERFFVSREGDVWICGDNNLFKYNSRTGKFLVYKANKNEENFGPDDIAEAGGGNYLVAAKSGLFRLNTASKKFDQIVSPLGGRESAVESVCVDKNGDVWYLNNNRLVYYQVKKAHFTEYGPEDGLNLYGELTCLRTFNGSDFYLAEGNRIVTFSLPGSLKSESPVILYLHGLQVNDSTLSQKRLHQPLIFSYNENKIGFEFGAINYNKPGQNLYAYRLSGIDNKWIYSTVNNVSYANLAPGSYTFTLKAENYSGLWSKPLNINIQIRHPYWGTWWFRLIGITLLSTILFIAIRYVLQRNLKERILILEKEKAVEQERNRIARDMHDDLGSGLTKIAVLSEVTKARLPDVQSATPYLDVISAASRELVDNLQGIIWVLNPKNDSVESLVLYLKEYTEGFFEHTAISLKFIFDEAAGNLSLSEEKRRNIFLVVKECCNNILKYAACTEVKITIAVKDKIVQIEIADNGAGFDVQAVSVFSNGLQNMKNRIQQIGGDFRLVSSPGHGTKVKCSIPV